MQIIETMYLCDETWVDDFSMSKFVNEPDKLKGYECMLCKC